MLNYTKEGVRIYLFHENRYTNKNTLRTVKLVAYFGAKSKYFPTGIKMSADEWKEMPTTKKKDLVEKRKVLETTFYKFKGLVDTLLEKNSFSLDNLSQNLESKSSKSILVKDCFQKKIDALKDNKQIGTAGLYELALKAFGKYDPRKLDLKHITIDWLKKYELHMLKEGRSYSTLAIYIRCMRTIMNEAISAGILDNSYYPFGRGKYEVPVGEGRKLALPLHTIKNIYLFESISDPTIPKYRDLWMFSYFCNGANFNDILRLKFKNINGNEISFFRGKTFNTSKKKKEIVVYLTDEMREIIERIGNPVQLPDNYIFPYLTGNESVEKEYEIIKDVIKRTNKRMKRISDTLGIPKITTYTARHSYATVLKRSGANIAFISESLGHSDLKTTENYLASFETEEREKNAKLLMAF